MTGLSNLNELLKEMKPVHQAGDFVFCSIADLASVPLNSIILMFKEDEGYTIIAEKKLADDLGLHYSYVASWITLTVHSSLDAVGFTAAFSKALSENDISCNVIAAFYHDHIFVNKKDIDKAMSVLNALSVN